MNPPELIPAALRRVGSRAFVYAAGDVIARGMSFVLLPLYTRVLSPEEYGTYGVALAVVGVLHVIVPLQMQAGVTVKYFSTEQDERRRLISAALICQAVSMMVISMLLLSTRRYWGRTVFDQADSEQFALLTIAIAMFGGLGAVPQAIMRLREQAKLLAGVASGTYVLGLGIGLYLVLRSGMGVRGLLLGSLIAVLLAVPVYAAYLRPELTRRVSRAWIWDNVRISLPLVPHLLAHWGLNLLDRVVLPRFVPLSDVGIYQLGYQAGMVFQIVVLAVNSAWVPYAFQRLSDESSHGDVRRVSTWLVHAQAWIGLGVALFIPEIIVLVVAPSFRDAVTVIPWIVLGFFMVALYHLWVSLLLFQGRTTLIPVATIAAALANLTLNLVLVPRLGYLGAAITTALSYASLAALTGLMVRRIGLSFPFEYAKWIVSGALAIAFFLIAAQVGEGQMLLRWSVKLAAWLAYPLVLGRLGLGGAEMLRGICRLLRPSPRGGMHPPE